MSRGLVDLAMYGLSKLTWFTSVEGADTNKKWRKVFRKIMFRWRQVVLSLAPISAMSVALMALTPDSAFPPNQTARAVLGIGVILSTSGILSIVLFMMLLSGVKASVFRARFLTSRRLIGVFSLVVSIPVWAIIIGVVACIFAVILMVVSSTPIAGVAWLIFVAAAIFSILLAFLSL
ncbi:hypothetical protein FPV67DRAFT_1452771 [Lyophyllum atratum]|nr:hypothetical protein FPV67DRAFT_1453834 [Lyophyllum atratum]KAF8060676.1 hypothetical protein FPV67DRAFT_1452771 [Lyophyllum atratum]